MFPLYEHGAFGVGASLVAALLIGLAFGWFLERGGLGSARKLAGQFLLTDLTVFKVLFSAVVTAMLGVFWLGRLGILDVALIHVPETWLLPQLAGGLAFGVGFAAAGLCPGTSCVAAATGRLDGVAVMLGMVVGALAFGAGYPLLAGFADGTARGVLTLPRLAGLSYGLVVAMVAGVALAAFRLAERVEGSRR